MKKLFKAPHKFTHKINRVINDWNSLPQFIVDSISVYNYKILLARHYKNILYSIYN